MGSEMCIRDRVGKWNHSSGNSVTSVNKQGVLRYHARLGEAHEVDRIGNLLRRERWPEGSSLLIFFKQVFTVGKVLQPHVHGRSDSTGSTGDVSDFP